MGKRLSSTCSAPSAGLHQNHLRLGNVNALADQGIDQCNVAAARLVITTISAVASALAATMPDAGRGASMFLDATAPPDCADLVATRPLVDRTDVRYTAIMLVTPARCTADAPDESLVQRLRELESARRRVEAETAELLAELDDRKVHRPEHASMWGLLRVQVGWSDRECKERMRIARLGTIFPDALELLADGRSSVANIAEIARGFANPRCGDQIESVIGTLFTESTRLEFDDFKRVVKRWERLADTDGSHRDAQQNHANRNAHVAVWDGVGHLVAEFGEADGLANREIFERFVETEFRADWEAVVAEHGDSACTELMPRTDAQRRADAITAIFESAASTPTGSRRPRPVLNVLVDSRTFEDLLIEHRLLPERFDDPFESGEPLVVDQRCESEHGDPIDPTTALQVAIHGLVRFVILDDEGVPIRWGRERRLFTGAARDAVLSLWPRCTAPGCRVRSRRSEADHTVPWAAGGRTDPDNGGPRCRRHNLLGNAGYTTRRDRRGRWHTYRPDGSEVG